MLNGPANAIVTEILKGITFPWESETAVWSPSQAAAFEMPDLAPRDILKAALLADMPIFGDATVVATQPDLGELFMSSCCGGACIGHSVDAQGRGSSVQANSGKASPEQMAKYLTTGFWTEKGEKPHSWDTKANNVITVDLTGVNADMKVLIRAALEAWEAVADIQFKEVNKGADITFSANGSGATTTTLYQTNGVMVEATVVVSQSWLNANGDNLGSYSTQTYIHEIGHALGLGHSGGYGTPGGTTYTNDSWQISAMSYNSQTENSSVNASKAVVLTPMTADIIAVQSLYGKPSGGPTQGNTVYGKNATLDTYLDDVFAGKGASMSKNAITIYDESGRDRIDFSTDTKAQKVDLNAGTYSNVYGKVGNLGIAKGTTIEDYTAGTGGDTVFGNAVSNQIKGMNGNDKLYGRGGGDTLNGGAGNDSMFGNDGNDRLLGGSGHDVLKGDAGNDFLDGGTGNDTMFGGSGQDVFVFNGGQDIIRDFQNDVDTLRIDDSLWGGKKMSVDAVLDYYAYFANGMVVFDFGGGKILRVDGISHVDALINDLVII